MRQMLKKVYGLLHLLTNKRIDLGIVYRIIYDIFRQRTKGRSKGEFNIHTIMATDNTFLRKQAVIGVKLQIV